VAKKQNFMSIERDANDGVLYECECLNIVTNEFHENYASPMSTIHRWLDKDQMKS